MAAPLLLSLSACAETPNHLPDPPYRGAEEVTPAPVLSPPAIMPGTALAAVLALADESLLRSPQPRMAITTQGLMFTDQAYVESSEAKRDWYRMLALALAARDTGQGRYRRALGEYLDAWLAVFRPGNDPISESQFDNLVLAVDLERERLAPAQQQALVRLFQRMANGYLDSSRYPPGTAVNNWQSHRIKLASLMAFAMRDQALIKRCHAAFLKQITENLRPDGSVLDFEARDALHYVTYSLEPLLLTALVAREHGQDWFAYQSPSGSSLNHSLRWLAEYASGRKTHEEFRNTVVEFDRRRARAGLPGYSGLWDPATAARCYQLAARLNPEWTQLADRLGPTPAMLELRFPAQPL